MNKYSKKFVLKVLLLSTIIVALFNIWDNYLNANFKKKENVENFVKVNNNSIGNSSIALGSNIGINYKSDKKITDKIYKDNFLVGEFENDKSKISELIGQNMIIIKEYLNILKTDPKELINSSYDKYSMLNSYIDALEYRYKYGVKIQRNLLSLKESLSSDMKNINSKIENVKNEIEHNFKKSDSVKSVENIEKYLDLKREYYFSRTYVVYINHFINQYNFLNNYTKDLAGVIVKNKEAIIKDAFVVIPKGQSVDALKKFDLLYIEK